MSSHEIVLQLTKEDGSVVQHAAPPNKSMLVLPNQQLIAVSDNIAELTRVTVLWSTNNAFTAIPAGVLAMTQLTSLILWSNRLVTIPPEIGRLMALTRLLLGGNALVALPREIGRLTTLEQLHLYHNALTAVPPELGRLPLLRELYLHDNRLSWLPLALDRLPSTTILFLGGNPLPIDVGRANATIHNNSRRKLPEIFAATSHLLAVIREPAFIILTALQPLFIPALLLVEILDEALPNSIPMYAKWELVVAVKHFHQRRGIER